MRAISASIVLLTGVVLFSVGYLKANFRGEDAVAVMLCLTGIGIGLIGFVTWLIGYIGNK